MTALTFGSLFAGIGGFDLGFARAGLVGKWQVEIDAPARGVLARHFPESERFADVRDVGAHNLTPVDVITFGSPCQDLSVAGRRAGLGGERSGLFFEAVRIIRELRPRYAIWENVPGALSSNGGRDFGAALDALADAGALDLCWRVLDAQWFGVAQRRRRVFLVASFGVGASAAAVLFESEGGGGNPPPRRTPGQGATGGAAPGAGSGGGWPAEVAPTLGTSWGYRSAGSQMQEMVAQKGGHFVPDVSLALTTPCGQRQDATAEQFITVACECADTQSVGANQTTGFVGEVVGVIPLLEVGARTNGDGYRDGDGIGQPGDPMYTLQASKQHGVLAPTVPEVAGTLTTGMGGHKGQDDNTPGFLIPIAFTNRAIEGETFETLLAASHGALPMVAFTQNQRDEVRGVRGTGAQSRVVRETLHAGEAGGNAGLSASNNQEGGRGVMAVRRLTPL